MYQRGRHCDLEHGLPPDLHAVTAEDACASTEVRDTATATCPVLYRPALAITRECPANTVEPGDTLIFTGTVYSPGNVTLRDVTMVNGMPAANTVVLGPITLASGASKDFAASYPIDARCCWVVDTLTAKGQDACTGAAVQNTATAVCDVLYAPALELTKQCLDHHRFSGVVKNTGNIVLTNVVVSTSAGAGGVRLLGPIELAIGETATFQGQAATEAPCFPP